MNTVIRTCNRCKAEYEQDSGFTYLRDGVWACDNCLSKYTHISEIIDEEKKHEEQKSENL